MTSTVSSPAATSATDDREIRAVLLGLRGAWARLGAASFAVNLLALAPTLYMLQVYDRVMASQNTLTLLAVSLITAAMLVGMALAEGWRSRWQVRTSLTLERSLSARVFDASARAGLNSLAAPGAQGLADLTTLRQFLVGPGVYAIFDSPWAPIYLAVLWLLHPLLAGTAFAFLLLQVGIAAGSQRALAQPTEAVNAAARREQTLLRGTARHAEVVEALGMLAALRRHWSQRRAQQRLLAGELQALTQRLGGVSRVVRQIQQSASLAVGAWLVIHGDLSPGAMIAANVLMGKALAPIDALVGSWKQALGARQAYGRIARLLSQYPDRPQAVMDGEPVGHLALIDVRATAPGREAPLLDGIHLAFTPGSVTALIGPSGAGKSTLARAAVGNWPEMSGEVTLDGHALAELDRDWLGRHIGYLPQDIELFDGSVAENICRFTQPDPAQVIGAAQACGLHEALLRLPRGYDTPVGASGHLLSGGMRQRIALARAVYGAPHLVVLDEPNANLDEAGEAGLAQLVHALKRQGSTVLIVSHRPAVLSVTDRIVVLENGRVRLDGPRDEVLAQLHPPAVRPVNAAPSAA
ncbi:MAG TPA: type I secretion system permease/ATPase [Burkholderiaceae bacterium]|nr:type I secretion system permease/ATPase [Burkholderiaceae bacterium]HNB45446.1 type I secretion system permease/ATPase [Burkholderiaceae bacterium]HNG81002.1 type I secretion system permease/ATPase [Burkholderiaceae bacterium]